MKKYYDEDQVNELDRVRSAELINREWRRVIKDRALISPDGKTLVVFFEAHGLRCMLGLKSQQEDSDDKPVTLEYTILLDPNKILFDQLVGCYSTDHTWENYITDDPNNLRLHHAQCGDSLWTSTLLKNVEWFKNSSLSTMTNEAANEGHEPEVCAPFLCHKAFRIIPGQ